MPHTLIRNWDELTSHGDREGRAIALEILEAGLAAADPYANTRDLIRVEGNRLRIGDHPELDVSGYGDEAIDLSEIAHIYVIGAGKAVQHQARALEDLLGDRLTAGAITVKRGEGCLLRRIAVTEAAHPVPDEASVSGTRKIVEIARVAGEQDLVFTLFSDGASSLLTLPAPTLTLEDVRQVYRLAIKYGSQRVIHEVMPYVSAVKCGRIMREIHPARSINLIMQVGLFPRWHGVLPEAGSWVPSWPPARRRMAQAARELQSRPWWDEFPPALQAILERVDGAYEVPDLETFRSMRASYWQPIDLYQMVEGARAKAEALGFRGAVLSSHLTALSSSAANVLAHIAHECEQYGHPFTPPVALITGGHLDVPVGDATGVGGRNQEFALLWGQMLGGGRLASKRIVVAAMDSDGTDGPGTQLGGGEMICMAGGIVDGETVSEAAALGIDLDAELANHNSTMALMRLGSAIHTGNTGTCLGDLRVALVR
ncbi:MAG: glycerate kinase [Anaerolineae bacterium]